MQKNKHIISAVLLVCILMCSTASALFSNTLAPTNETHALSTIVADDMNNRVMTGPNKTTLLVHSVSRTEYQEMMSLMYPNGIVDSQGQEIGAIKNADEFRSTYIAGHTKAYSINNKEKAQLDLVPFSVTLSTRSCKEQEALLYKTSIGQDDYIFPSEWGRQGFGFVHLSEKGIYLAFTDVGIWRIDPTTMTAKKLTSDTYDGKTIEDIGSTLYAQLGDRLSWVDSVDISPDGKSVIYRTNRDTDTMNSTSIWSIDLNSGAEKQLLTPAKSNDIVGFLSETQVLVGSLDNTRAVDLSTGKVLAVEFPDLPNFDIKAVNNGKVAYTSYADDNTKTILHIDFVDVNTGTRTAFTQVDGYWGKLTFSPAGDKIAIKYGTDCNAGTNDIMLIDTKKGTSTLISSILMKPTTKMTQLSTTSISDISDYCWLDNDTLLLEQHITQAMPNEILDVALYTSGPYSVVFGSIPPSIVNFISPLSTNSTSGFVNVNSKWNQPRSGGTNPHNGVDVYACWGTSVYAPYAGWTQGITNTGNYDIQFLVDANNNRIQDDGDYYIHFYHMSSRESNGYKDQGELIGKSGDAGGYPAHLHFGVCSLSGGIKWLRNEVNYRYLASTKWNSGKDLDIYAYVSWDNGVASLDAYIRNDGLKEDLAEVRLYYRTTASGAWTDGGIMQKSGDTYSYNFRNILPQGTTVYWMARLTRSGISQRAFCPAKYYQPDANPNSTTQPYAYFTNIV